MASTIRDVAKLAGVSPSTVSRTLRNNPSISLKTQEKVRQAMKELNYQLPSPVQTGPIHPRTIGIIMMPSETSSFNNPFFMDILRGITQCCSQSHYLSTLITGNDDAEILKYIQEMNEQDSIASYIVLFSRMNDPVVQYLYTEGIDFVQIGHPASHPNEIVAVDNDNISAGQEAARYLYNLGHRKIAYLGSDFNQYYSAARRNGIRLFLADHNLPFENNHSIEMDYGDARKLNELRKLIDLDNPDRPTAIIASDEIHALALRQICAEKNVRIPDDLSIIAFNNSIISYLTSPALSSIDINAVQLGKEAAWQAIKHLENPDLLPSRTMVPYVLVERDSCKAIDSSSQS